MSEFDKTMPMSVFPAKSFRVWMLFAAGSAAEIELTCHRNEVSADRPVKVYPLCDCSIACVRAGDKAAEAAYLEYGRHRDEKETFRLGYDLRVCGWGERGQRGVGVGARLLRRNGWRAGSWGGGKR